MTCFGDRDILIGTNSTGLTFRLGLEGTAEMEQKQRLREKLKLEMVRLL
jgi:hypothetical protein